MTGIHAQEYKIDIHKYIDQLIKKYKWCMIPAIIFKNHQMENILCYTEHGILSLSNYLMDLH